MTTPVTAHDRAKAERSDAIRHEAALLFAARGYNGVSLEDIGAAVGVSGPAVYRHFAGKQALLGSVLVKVSHDLLTGGTRVATADADAEERMEALIRFIGRHPAQRTTLYGAVPEERKRASYAAAELTAVVQTAPKRKPALAG